MVDDSLAHGQARHLHRELLAEWERAWKGSAEHLGIEKTVPSEDRAAKTFARIRGRFLGSRTIEIHKYGPMQRAAFVEYPDHRETLVAECNFCFERESRHVYRLNTSMFTVLVLEPHAVARILQRKQTLEAVAVKDELRPSVGSLMVLAAASQSLNYRQFAVPTPSGLLAGVVEYEGRTAFLRAKTFMTQLSPDRVRLREELLPLVTDARASLSFARAAFHSHHDELVDALRQNGWLGEPLVRGRDDEGEMWAKAPTRTGG